MKRLLLCLFLLATLAGCKQGVTRDPTPSQPTGSGTLVDPKTGWETVGTVPVQLADPSVVMNGPVDLSLEGDSVSLLFSEGFDPVFFTPLFFTARLKVDSTLQTATHKHAAGFDPDMLQGPSKTPFQMLAPGTGSAFVGAQDAEPSGTQFSYSLKSPMAGFSAQFLYASNYLPSTILVRPLSNSSAYACEAIRSEASYPTGANDRYFFSYTSNALTAARDYRLRGLDNLLADVGGAELGGRFLAAVLGYDGRLSIVDPFLATDSTETKPTVLAAATLPEFVETGGKIAVKPVEGGLLIAASAVVDDNRLFAVYRWTQATNSLEQVWLLERGESLDFLTLDLHAPNSWDLDAQGRLYQLEQVTVDGLGRYQAMQYGPAGKTPVGGDMLTNTQAYYSQVSTNHIRVLGNYLYAIAFPTSTRTPTQRMDVVRIKIP